MTPKTLGTNKHMFKLIRKTISIVVLITFIATSVKSPAYAQAISGSAMPWMPKPGVMIAMSPPFNPANLKGMIIHPENSLQFDFIINRGDDPLTEDQKKTEYNKLIKYFLASLATPDDDQWVNLSPYEKDRIIKDDFAKTEMGRDVLAEDYILKQITSSLIYPESKLGQKFWDKVYTEAQQQFGTTNVPLNTFNKVWIVPDEAVVYEKGNIVYLQKSHLKVMMEEDYLSLTKHTGITNTADANKTHALGSQIVKEIVIPELEREVNEGKNFAPLRQVFSGVILAVWYKQALKESLLGKIYADKSKVKGVDQDPQTNEIIYKNYLKAFKKGVFNYIKEDVDKYTNETIPRKYFSGGWQASTLDDPKILQRKKGDAPDLTDGTAAMKDDIAAAMLNVSNEKPTASAAMDALAAIDFNQLGSHRTEISTSANPESTTLRILTEGQPLAGAVYSRLDKNTIRDLRSAAMEVEKEESEKKESKFDQLMGRLQKIYSDIPTTTGIFVAILLAGSILRGCQDHPTGNQVDKIAQEVTKKLDEMAEELKTNSKQTQELLRQIGGRPNNNGSSSNQAMASASAAMAPTSLRLGDRDYSIDQLKEMLPKLQNMKGRIEGFIESKAETVVKDVRLPRDSDGFHTSFTYWTFPLDPRNDFSGTLQQDLAKEFLKPEMLEGQKYYQLRFYDDVDNNHLTEPGTAKTIEVNIKKGLLETAASVLRKLNKSIKQIESLVTPASAAMTEEVVAAKIKEITVLATKIGIAQALGKGDAPETKSAKLKQGSLIAELGGEGITVTISGGKIIVNRKPVVKAGGKNFTSAAMKTVDRGQQAKLVDSLKKSALSLQSGDTKIKLPSEIKNLSDFIPALRDAKIIQFNGSNQFFLPLMPKDSPIQDALAVRRKALNDAADAIAKLPSAAMNVRGKGYLGDLKLIGYVAGVLTLGVFAWKTTVSPLIQEQSIRDARRNTMFVNIRNSGKNDLRNLSQEQIDFIMSSDFLRQALVEKVYFNNREQILSPEWIGKTPDQFRNNPVVTVAATLKNRKDLTSENIEDETVALLRGPVEQEAKEEGIDLGKHVSPAMKLNGLNPTNGGIDLNAANLNLQIKRDGKGVPLPFSQQDIGQLNRIEGLIPVIMEIKPASAVPILSQAAATTVST